MNNFKHKLDIQFFAAKDGLTVQSDITVTVREIDFVTRFARNWDSLREILGIMRPIKKMPGTKLTSYTASMKSASLQGGASVGEGEEIPYTEFQVSPVAYADITLEKYAKAVSVEAVAKFGAVVAVQRTDDAFLNELTGNVLGRFYTYLQTGSLTSVEDTFQMAVAMAVGRVIDKFKKMRRDSTNIVVFVNTLDAYKYLGAAELTLQNAFGIQYVQNFMGANTMILSSEIPEGKIIATPSENIVLYYIDPSDSDFAQLGLNYTVQGETNLVGFHANGNYNTAVGESFALMGLTLWAEYLDGIAVATVEDSGSMGSISGFSTAAGSAVGKSLLTVPDPSVSGGKYYFKSQASTAPSAPTYLDKFDTTGWTEVVDDQEVTATNGHKYRVVEVNGAGQAIATADGTVVAKTS